MRLNKDHKIEKAVGDIDTRYIMQSMNLETEHPDGPRLVATTGHILAVLPVELDDGDTAGFITTDAIKAARKAAGRGAGDMTVHANGALVIPDGPTYARPEEGKFPDVDRVVPERCGAPTVTLSANLLLKLAEALACNGKGRRGGVSLWVGDVETHDPIVVRPAGEDENSKGAYGVIMPMRA